MIVPFDVDHRQVRALGDTQQPRVQRAVAVTDEDAQKGGAGHHMVVGDRQPRRVDDEAATAAGGVELLAELGVSEGALGNDPNDCPLDVLQRADRSPRLVRCFRRRRTGRRRGGDRLGSGGLSARRIGVIAVACGEHEHEHPHEQHWRPRGAA